MFPEKKRRWISVIFADDIREMIKNLNNICLDLYGWDVDKKISKSDMKLYFSYWRLTDNGFLINKNKGLDPSVRLADADFWNSSQSVFISDAISLDSDWSEIVDVLNTLLR